MDPSVKPQLPKTPELEPVFLVNLRLESGPAPIFSDPKKDKSLSLAKVVDGYIETVKNKYGFELEVKDISGIDEITAHTSDGYNTLDCKLYGKTAEGAGVYITYGGVMQLTEPIINVLTGKADSSSFEEGYLTSSPVIQFDREVSDKYRWAVKENLVGKGRFIKDSKGAIYVQYYIYVYR